jgi:hypothetical protein
VKLCGRGLVARVSGATRVGNVCYAKYVSGLAGGTFAFKAVYAAEGVGHSRRAGICWKSIMIQS